MARPPDTPKKVLFPEPCILLYGYIWIPAPAGALETHCFSKCCQDVQNTSADYVQTHKIHIKYIGM